MGSLGEPDGGWPKTHAEDHPAGAQAAARPSRRASAAGRSRRDRAPQLEKKIGRKPSHDEVLSYLMYPDVFLEVRQARQNYGDVDVLPTPQFFYGMERGEEIAVELEPGKTLVIKFLTVGEPHPDGTPHGLLRAERPAARGDGPRPQLEVTRSANAARPTRPAPGQVGAPIPGVVSTVAVELTRQ